MEKEIRKYWLFYFPSGVRRFHLVELPEKEALRIVNLYLDQGGST